MERTRSGICSIPLTSGIIDLLANEENLGPLGVLWPHAGASSRRRLGKEETRGKYLGDQCGYDKLLNGAAASTANAILPPLFFLPVSVTISPISEK